MFANRRAVVADPNRHHGKGWPAARASAMVDKRRARRVQRNKDVAPFGLARIYELSAARNAAPFGVPTPVTSSYPDAVWIVRPESKLIDRSE